MPAPGERNRSRHQQVARVLWIILALNVLVAAAKVIVGFAINSLSMVADGFHSVSDGSSNIIGLVGIRIASQPPDHDHPYGHRKFETFATLPIAGFLLLAAYRVGASVVTRLSSPGDIPTVTTSSFVIMGATVLINMGVTWYERREGQKLQSDFLVADASHTLSDVWVSLSVIVSLAAVRLGYPIVDAVVGGVIAIVIAWTAIGIGRRGAQILGDAAVLEADVVRETVMQVKGVREAHEIRTRGRPDYVHVDLHVIVDSRMPVEKAHDLSHEIEQVLKGNHQGVEDVIVHLEPEDEMARSAAH